MRIRRWIRPGLVALVIVGALPAGLGCAGDEGDLPEKRPEDRAEAAPDPGELVPNGMMPFEGILVGGQPSPDQLKALSALGYRTVINMRLPGEEGSTDPGVVRELGMDYVSIPLPGAAGITEENARRLAEALESSPRPVLVHCASGNRIGAIFGMKAWALDGASPGEAMEIARKAGITRLEPRLAEIVGLEEGEPAED